MILLQGKGTFLIGDETQDLEATNFVHVPKGVIHHFKNTGTSQMVTVHIYGPTLTPDDTVRVP